MIAIHKDTRDMEKRIGTIFLSNKILSTLIIPIKIARNYGLDKPSNVIVEEKEGGIFIRKLEV